MLEKYALKFLVIGWSLSRIERLLLHYRADNQKNLITVDTSKIKRDHEIISSIKETFDSLLKDCNAIELEAVALRIRRMTVDLLVDQPIEVNDLLEGIAELKDDFSDELNIRFFHYVRPDLKSFYGRQDHFGPSVEKKFSDSLEDIEHAGNCIALSENTAAILHLMRAMEGAVRVLGRKLKVTINPKDTWGMILKNMDHKIEALPEKTTQQKQKKTLWSESRVNLFHVKQAWRDDSMHGKRTYTEPEARQIFETVKVFMIHLATL